MSADKMNRAHQTVIPACTPGADFRIIWLRKTYWLCTCTWTCTTTTHKLFCAMFLKPNNYKSEIPEEVGKHFLFTKINSQQEVSGRKIGKTGNKKKIPGTF